MDGQKPASVLSAIACHASLRSLSPSFRPPRRGSNRVGDPNLAKRPNEWGRGTLGLHHGWARRIRRPHRIGPVAGRARRDRQALRAHRVRISGIGWIHGDRSRIRSRSCVGFLVAPIPAVPARVMPRPVIRFRLLLRGRTLGERRRAQTHQNHRRFSHRRVLKLRTSNDARFVPRSGLRDYAGE